MKQGSSALLIAVALLAVACADAAEPAPVLETEEQKTLYALGLVISANLRDVQFTAEEWAVVRMGMTDGVLGNEEKVDLEVYGPKIEALMQGKAAAATAKDAAGRLRHVSRDDAREQAHSGALARVETATPAAHGIPRDDALPQGRRGVTTAEDPPAPPYWRHS